MLTILMTMTKTIHRKNKDDEREVFLMMNISIRNIRIHSISSLGSVNIGQSILTKNKAFSLQLPTSPPTKQLKNTTPSKRDRKSTRLNSSHVSISYAVFCLKK